VLDEVAPKESSMTKNASRQNRSASDQLHSLIYTAVVGLVLWFTLSAWVFFDDGGYAGLLLAVVSGFFCMAVAIPFALWLTWRRHREPEAKQDARFSLRDWASGAFDTLQGPQRATQAAIEILLPFAAVAIGMTAFGIVLHFVSMGADHT
jgi:hypothetical protein